MTKVAIITRTKSRPIFLVRAIQSVSQQIYTDYIHVIVNDGGSKDEVESIIGQYDAGVRSKIKLFHRDVSSGAPDTIFNESIDRVESEFFAIHDDDDTWHPNFLQETVAHLDKDTELAAVVVRTDKVIESMVGDTIRTKKIRPWMPDIKVINLYRQCIDNQITPISTLFRRSAYEKVGKFDSSLPVVGDWEFGIRLLSSYDIDFIDPGYALAKYHHRISKDNSFAKHDHRYYANKVMNKYLREELGRGEFGVGYIMSQLKYDQSFIATTLKKFLPASIVGRLKKRVDN